MRTGRGGTGGDGGGAACGTGNGGGRQGAHTGPRAQDGGDRPSLAKAVARRKAPGGEEFCIADRFSGLARAPGLRYGPAPARKAAARP